MNKKDLPTVLWCLLVVLLFFWLYCITTVTPKWSGAEKRIGELPTFFFSPLRATGACSQAKKEIGTGTDRTGRLSWEMTKELL